MSLLTEYISFNFIIKRLRIMISKVYCSFHCLLSSSFYFTKISLKLFELFKIYIFVKFWKKKKLKSVKKLTNHMPVTNLVRYHIKGGDHQKSFWELCLKWPKISWKIRKKKLPPPPSLTLQGSPERVVISCLVLW